MPTNGTQLLRVVVVLMFFAIAIGGCGGRKIVSSEPKELVIPENLAKAFEVKELPKQVSHTDASDGAGSSSKLVGPTVKTGKTKRSASKASKSEASKSQGPQGVVGPASRGFAIPSRRPVKDPLWVGEKIWMDVTWLSTKAGEFLLEVLPFKEIDGRKVYDLKGTARTSDLFSLVYRAEDWVQSFVDYEGWFPYKFVLHGDETKHVRNHLELFDHSAKKTVCAHSRPSNSIK